MKEMKAAVHMREQQGTWGDFSILPGENLFRGKENGGPILKIGRPLGVKKPGYPIKMTL